MGDSPNAYEFAHNQPTSYWDAHGLMAGHLQPIPGHPGKFRLIPGEKDFPIPRCHIVILAGHTSLMPGKMSVKRKDRGCAYGEMYGCLTGGGDADLDDGRTVVVSPFDTPGIPGAPKKPTDFIDDNELQSLADAAFAAAKNEARNMCKRCCCDRIFIITEAVFSDDEFDRWRDYDKALIEHLQANSTVVECK
jgi:hypothetical protein